MKQKTIYGLSIIKDRERFYVELPEESSVKEMIGILSKIPPDKRVELISDISGCYYESDHPTPSMRIYFTEKEINKKGI